MKIKKLFLMLSMLCSLGAVSAPTFSNNIKTNNDLIIVNNEKVNLRQKAIKKANDTSSVANIETTNVDYDLRYIFGGEKNYLSYNIWDLVPTSNDSKDTSFKFLCAKPVGTNLYLYVYHNDNRNGNIISATTKISKSKSLNSETGEFIENFALYNARFINSYGYKQRFMKFAIDNIFNSDEDVRCFIENFYIRYQDTSTTNYYFTNTYTIQDEFMFGLNNGDFMYEYFKNDYVKITSGYVSLQLVGDKPISGVNNSRTDNFYTYDENFYYFFNTDRKIDELIEVQYDYILSSYEVDWHTGLNYNGVDWITKVPCYNGGLDVDYRGYWHSEPTLEYFTNQKIISGKEVIEVERPWFFGWNQTIKYTQENIVDLSDNGLKKIDDEVVKDYFSEKRTHENNKYSWAFKICSTEREAIKYGSNGNFFTDLIGTSELNSRSSCHEVKQSLITWLKFRTNNILFEFNTLDIPKDATNIDVMYIPYKTLGDIIIENSISFFDWFINSGGWQTILILLGILGGVLLFIYLYPFISTLFKNIKSKFKTLSDNTKMIKNDIKKKRESNKKKRAKKKKTSSNKKNKKPKKKGG